MAGIFISYRRDDTAGYAGWLYERLSARFGAERVFMDVDSIEPGFDFVEIVQETVGKSGAVVALMGPQWLTVTDLTGRRRLDDPNDFVRIELRTALEKSVRVIPTLVHGAQIPRTEDLPEDLQPLVRRNAIELSDARFSYDVRRLIDALERALGATGQGPLPAAGAAAPSLEGEPSAATTSTAVVQAPPRRTFSRRTLSLWGGAAAVLAALIIVLAVALLNSGGSPRHAAGATNPTATAAPATSTPVPTATRPPATRPPAARPTTAPAAAPTSAPTTAPPATSAPVTAPTSAPAVTRPTARSAQPTTRPAPTQTPRPVPTATPRSSAPPPRPATVPAAFETNWRTGLSGWSVGAPGAWSVRNGILRFDGSGVDQIVAPVRAPAGPYFIQSRMRFTRCRGSQVGFGLYIRIPPGASDGNDGIFAGTWLVQGRHLATLWSLSHGFYHQAFWRPFTRWHVYRVVVRGAAVRLFIDGRPYGAATVRELLPDRQVGLGSLDCAIDVVGFRLHSLK
jgi:hypothetical protein